MSSETRKKVISRRKLMKSAVGMVPGELGEFDR